MCLSAEGRELEGPVSPRLSNGTAAALPVLKQILLRTLGIWKPTSCPFGPHHTEKTGQHGTP